MALNVLGGNVPSIVNPIPFGIIPAPFGSPTFQITDVAYDYAIGGIPFFAGESLRGSYFRRQYLRDYADIKKDQFDALQDPGEQSLVGWWLRAQSNFQQGGGSQYLDTLQDQTLAQRYLYSEHMDMLSIPWQVGLLPASKRLLSSGNTNLLLNGANYNGTDLILVADGLVLKQITSAGVVTSYSMPGGITALKSLTVDGTNYYFVDTTGIYSGAIGVTGTPATKLWDVPSSSGNNVIHWVKGRLVAGMDNNVYELVGGSPPTLPTPKFTHQNPAYVFSSIEEIPQAILVSGYAGGGPSQIHQFVLDSGGALPTLSSGVVAADMPIGEIIYEMYSYLGGFLGIGTNQGMRVATVDPTTGNLTYGPLDIINPNGVQAMVGEGRFLFFSNNENGNIPYQGWTNPSSATDTSGIMRLDLSQNTSTGGYPYCSDLDSHTSGTVVAMDHLGTSTTGDSILVFSVAGEGVYCRDLSNKEPSGAIFSSKIRFNTLEPKHFKYVYLRTPIITDGQIQVVVNDPGGGSTSIFTQGAGTTTEPTLIGTEGNGQEWIQLQFNFLRGTSDTNVTPLLNGYQLRGLPGVNRQIVFTVPLLCFDYEMDRFGVLNGYDGFAMERIQALEQVTQSGNLILFQDLNYGLQYLVIVDSQEFQQQASERGKTSQSNSQDATTRGGFLILQCRVVQ